MVAIILGKVIYETKWLHKSFEESEKENDEGVFN